MTYTYKDVKVAILRANRQQTKLFIRYEEGKKKNHVLWVDKREIKPREEP